MQVKVQEIMFIHKCIGHTPQITNILSTSIYKKLMSNLYREN